MMKYFSQIDPEWDGEMLGDTTFSMRLWGCLTASVCNVIQKIYKFFDFTPRQAARNFKYLRNGKLIHSSIKFKGLEHRRIWGRPSNDLITQYTNNPEKAILVRLRYNPRHWVMVHKWTVWFKPWFLAVDPYTYNSKTKTCRIVRKLKYNIDGGFLFFNGH